MEARIVTKPKQAASATPFAAVERPIFIVGPGRSGSTLLRSMLSAHARIAVTPETHFMASAEPWGLHGRGPADVEAFWSRYLSNWRFDDVGVSAGRCRELLDAQGRPSFRTAFRALLAAYGEKTGKRRVGEKTPGHSRFLSYLLDWFPEARILVTQRDPRAVVASQMHTAYVRSRLTPRSLRHGIVSGKRSREIAFYADNWARVFEERLAPWRGDPRFHTILYERLVDDPETELRAVCAFLGEDYDPSMLTERGRAGISAPNAERTDGSMQRWLSEHHAKTLGPVTSGSLQKWRHELTGRELAMIEGRCDRAMRGTPYMPETTHRRRSIGRLAATTISAAGTAETRLRGLLSNRLAGSVLMRSRSALSRAGAASVAHGLPTRWVGYRWMRRETVQQYFARRGETDRAGRYESVHPEQVAHNPLPRNMDSRSRLPDDRGWWGYSFHDVPERVSGETFIATIPDCLVTWYRDPYQSDDFYPAIVTGDHRALDMREMRFRPRHSATLRNAPPPARLERAVWILERVYHNHSHWLTAHLPKLLLLQERGMLEDILLPPRRTTAMDGSLKWLGLDPEAFPTFDPSRPLRVDALTVVGTDRFRPELLRSVSRAFGVLDLPPPRRKVFISRANAARRRLVNEDEIWTLLDQAGFERVVMEDLSFEAQVALMQETAVLLAPHGAGLTNMLFCPPGSAVVEIADLGFPNPNFYAMASALGHRYWLISAESLGQVHPLEKDLRVDPALVKDVLPSLAREAPI